ncbi:MAG: YlbF family regulator [Clostridia bacterium]|nr:YlbF family regulator [Clostridia bacterium]
MDHIEAASALGQAIVNSQEYREFKAAEYGTVNDKEAAKLLLGYRQAQEAMVKAARGETDRDELENVRAALLEKQRELDLNPVIKRYLDSKKAYDRMMQEVDSVLGHFLGGGAGECSGSCEGCGGCG